MTSKYVQILVTHPRGKRTRAQRMRLTSDYICAREDSAERSKEEEGILKEVQKYVKMTSKYVCRGLPPGGRPRAAACRP